MDLELPDAALVADEVFDAGLDAVMLEPKIAHIRAKLTEREIRMLTAVIVTATATIATRQLVAALFASKSS